MFENPFQDMSLKEPSAEIDINLSLVRSLMDSQFPKFKDLEISFLDSGWDNENYRLGADHIIRLPRRSAAIPLLENEINWLPRLKDLLPIDIPAPIHVGKSNNDYPWKWSIIPWYDGENGCRRQPDNNEVIRLAEFLKSLHHYNPTNPPLNDHRCLPLSHKSDEVLERINRLKRTNDLVNDRIIELWQTAIAEPIARNQSLIHGDLHPRNIIIHDGRINAVIDWGDITSGDVATDLASFWMMFDDADIRQEGLNHYGADRSTINKSIGWAIFFGSVFLDLGTMADNEYADAGQRIFRNLNNP